MEASARALTELIKKIGQCTLWAHSQGAESEQSVQILASLLTDALPISADLQCLLWASDKIGDSIDAFAIERSQHSGIFSWLAQKRAKFLKAGMSKSLTANGNFILRDFPEAMTQC